MALPTQKLSRIYKVSFTSGNVFDFIAACAQNQLVEFAEQVPFDEVMIEPNDPSYPNGSYQLPLINAAAAFDIHQGGTTIAIVDDAVLTTHEDLASNIDNGWDVADNDPNTNPPLIGSNAATPNSFSHGTHVSGIAGGVTDNGIGIASIGWNNRILPIKATRDDIPNGRQITHGYEGLAFAASQGARIINNSWGGTAPSQANYLVVQAANDAGSIIVAAAGNANTTLPMYPAAYGEGTTGSAWEATNRSLVIAVASVDADGARSIWPGVLGNGGSNFGLWVDVSSYGTQILSSVVGSGFAINAGYARYNGTSMATPLVSGLLGLMASYKPAYSNADLIQCLLSTANNDIYQNAANIPGTLGTGRIDAFAALRCMSDCLTGHPIASAYASNQFLCQNERVDLTANLGVAYAWSNGETTQIISVGTPGTYIVTVTFEGGCTSTASVVIDPAPTEALIIAQENSGLFPNDGILCGPGFLSVTAFWGLSYEWNAFGPPINNQQTIGSINAGTMLPFTWNYAVTVTGVGGCPGVISEVTGSATWHPLPNGTIDVSETSQTPNDGIICSGANVILRASGGTSFLWSTGETVETINVSPMVTNTYVVTITDVNGCMDIVSFQIQVIDCPSTLTCPCSGTNQLNIEASEDGTSLASLEALFDFDQNDDGVISLQEHNNCIAIGGRLIIDTDLRIEDCELILMQPCSEISVEPNRHLDMNNNYIISCEQMWRGIRVQPLGRLTFEHNWIEDAQHAITAIPSVGWPPFFPTPLIWATTVRIRHNTFNRNHIGVMVPEVKSGNLFQQPFTRNYFFGNFSTPNPPNLQPPCEELANYSNASGYAGVVCLSGDFVLGSPNDIATSNTFSRLRNAVIAENGSMQVYRAHITDLIGTWTNENIVPSFGQSTGIGVLGNNSVLTVRNSYFNRIGHGIYSNNTFTTASGNDMPDANRGIECLRPLGFRLIDNDDIVYRNRGIIARELQPGFWNQWEPFAVHRNTVRNFTVTGVNEAAGDIAIEMRNGIGNTNTPMLQLLNARMHNNHIPIDGNDIGIRITGTGQWVLDDNVVTKNAFNGINPISASVHIQASGSNFLTNNILQNISTTSSGNGFNVVISPNTYFCCNETFGHDIGNRFVGACGQTQLRTADYYHHNFALELSANCVIGEQGVSNANHGNLFNTTSGTARHFGSTQQIVRASNFHVLSGVTPDYPEAVIALNQDPNDPWFQTNGLGDFNCMYCPNFVDLPVGTSILTEGEERIAEGVFTDGTLGEQALQWELSKQLYRKMEDNPELQGTNWAIDQFYNNAQTGTLGAYVKSGQKVEAINHLSESNAQVIARTVSSVEQRESELRNKLSELATKTTWSDSLLVYDEANQLAVQLANVLPVFLQTLSDIESERAVKANTALQEIEALPSLDVLTSNQKKVMHIYAESIGKNRFTLSTEEAIDIFTIAHQCVEEGGEAVLLARAIYQLYEQKHFEDLDYCNTFGRMQVNGETAYVPGKGILIQPNPVDKFVRIVLSREVLETEPEHLTVTNQAGIVVHQIKINPQAFWVEMDVADLPDGMYICHLTSAKGRPIAQKLIVQH